MGDCLGTPCDTGNSMDINTTAQRPVTKFNPTPTPTTLKCQCLSQEEYLKVVMANGSRSRKETEQVGFIHSITHKRKSFGTKSRRFSLPMPLWIFWSLETLLIKFLLSPTCSEVSEAENCPNLPVIGDTPSYKPPVQRVMLSTLLNSIFSRNCTRNFIWKTKIWTRNVRLRSRNATSVLCGSSLPQTEVKVPRLPFPISLTCLLSVASMTWKAKIQIIE